MSLLKDKKARDKKQEKEAKKEAEQIVDRLVPIARYVLELIVSSKPPIGVLPDKPGEVNSEYKELALKIQQKFLDENIKWIDRHYVFQLAKQALEQTESTVLDHLQKSFGFASDKLWGKTLIDLEMTDVDKVLKG